MATQPDPPGVPVRIVERLVVAATVAALCAAIAYAMLHRDAWYDEFYTLYVVHSGFGWGEAFTGHWLTDNHPPLYYALARAAGLFGASLEAHRFVNLAIAIGAIATGVVALRGSRGGRAVAIGLLLMLASQSAIFPFTAELRSYFLSVCAIALLCLVLFTVWTEETPPTRACMAVLWAAALAGFNIHIVTSLIAGSLMAAFLAGALASRDVARFRLLLWPALASGALFTATVAVQAQLWIANTRSFWIPAGFGQGIGSLRIVLDYAFVPNIVLFLAGLWGLAMLVHEALRDRRLPRELSAALLFAAAGLIASACVLAVHMWRPFVIPKYLVGLFPCLAMIAAVGFGRTMRSLVPRLAAVVVLAAFALTLFGLARSAQAIVHQSGWDAAARVLAAQAKRCPATLVHADRTWNRNLIGMQPPDNARVVPFAYELTALRTGLVLEPPASRRLAGDCPTLIWGENASQTMPTARSALVRARERGFALDQLWLHPAGSGWVASDRALGLSGGSCAASDGSC